MCWGGNIIARSLALVAVGTGIAFVHWGFRPLTTEIPPPSVDPELAPDTGPAGPAGDGTPSGVTPSGVSPASDAGSGDGGAPAQAEAPFDPNKLPRDVGTRDTYRLWQTGLVTFIDARPANEYEAGHIPLAVHVPPESVKEGRLGDLIEITGIGPSDRVLIYCEGGSCDASHLVGLRLAEMGFTRIHIDTDGFPGWVAAGYEVEEGPDQLLGAFP